MPRLRKTAKWAGTVVCAVTAGVVVVASWDPISVRYLDVEAVVSRGQVFFARTPDWSWMARFYPATGLSQTPIARAAGILESAELPPTTITRAEIDEAVKRAMREQRANSAISAVRERGGSWRPSWDYFSGYWGLSLPLWIPFLLFAVPTALLWRRDHIATKRARIGRCPLCGYDRRGLAADAKCPECGTV
jgi:hypothetical protein